MSNKYVLVNEESYAPTRIIEAVTNNTATGVSWREAKKQLREYYLNKAKALRTVTEKDYFNNA